MGWYEGIQESFPNLPPRMSDFLQLMRPFTVVAPLTMAFLIMASERLFHGETIISSPFILKVILAGLSMGLLQIVGQVSNQICDGSDYDIMAGKGYRPLCRGVISRSEAWTVVFISLILSLSIGFYIKHIYGLFMMVLLFFAVFNNLEPIRVKKRFVWNEVWLGISRGFIPPVAFWAVLDGVSTLPILIGLVGFLYVFACNWVKDINDFEADRMFDVETLVVHFNKDVEGIAMIIMPSLIAMTALIGLIANMFGWYFIGLLGFVIFASVILFRVKNERMEKMDRMENTLEWVLFYVGMVVSYFLLFAFLRIDLTF